MKEFSELTDIVTQNFKWHKARKDTLILLLCAILVRQTANLSKLAEYFPDAKAVKNSSYQRIYRFFREVEFQYGLVAQVIMGWLKCSEVKLTLDRTHWQFGKKHINILMLAIVYKHVAIPIFWKLLDNGKGNSKLDDRIELIELFKTTFPNIQIVGLLADREFVGKDWFKWLNKNELTFCIPIRKNNVVRRKGRKDTVPVERLFGDVKRKGDVKHLSKAVEVCGQKLFLSAVCYEDGSLTILASNQFRGVDLLNEYKLRWQIETLFSCFKSRGLDIESSHLTLPERMSKLVAVLSLAFAWAYVSGQWLNEQKPIEIKFKGKENECLAFSFFRVGLSHLAKACMKILSSFQLAFEPMTFIHLLR